MTNLAVCMLALEANILSIDGSFLFIFMLVICLIFILNATLFRPLNRVLDERERLTGGRMGEARRMLEQYEERVRRYEERVRTARAEAYQRLEAQRRQALAKRQEIITQAKAETAAQIAVARQEIEAQAKVARASLAGEAHAIAASISAHILQRPVTSPEGIGA